MKPNLTKNGVSALAIVSLTIIGGLGIGYDVPYVHIVATFDIAAIAGLGGYSVKKDQIPFAERESRAD